jgi:hypothetical protein
MARGRDHCTPSQRWCVLCHNATSPLIRIEFFLRSDQVFLILYRELYYRHVYSRLQPNIDDRFHSYENSCELFNHLLSPQTGFHTTLPLSLTALRRFRWPRVAGIA